MKKLRTLAVHILATAGLLLALTGTAFAQQQKTFQGTIQVFASAGNGTKVSMPFEQIVDVSRFREVTVRYRAEKWNDLHASTASTIKLQTAMNPNDETEWKDIGTGVSLTGSSSTASLSSETVSVTSSQVLLRYLRWQVVFNSPGSTSAVITFSIDIIGHI